MNVNKIVNKIAGYRDNTWLILVGDYCCVTALSKIANSVWTNGRGGHSFGTIIKDGEKEIIKAGGFDGDGAAYINWIAVGTDGSEFRADQFYDLLPDQPGSGKLMNEGSFKGNSLLIIKGTEEGVKSIAKIFDSVFNYVETSESFCHVVTDDNPPIDCGSYGGITMEQDFGFYVITYKKTIFDEPLKAFTKFGQELDFFNR